MLRAFTVRRLIDFTPTDLSMTLADSGYTGCSFTSVEFLGINNAGQFVFEVKYPDEGGLGGIEVGKVFVRFDFTTASLVAEF